MYRVQVEGFLQFSFEILLVVRRGWRLFMSSAVLQFSFEILVITTRVNGLAPRANPPPSILLWDPPLPWRQWWPSRWGGGSFNSPLRSSNHFNIVPLPEEPHTAFNSPLRSSIAELEALRAQSATLPSILLWDPRVRSLLVGIIKLRTAPSILLWDPHRE